MESCSEQTPSGSRGRLTDVIAAVALSALPRPPPTLLFTPLPDPTRYSRGVAESSRRQAEESKGLAERVQQEAAEARRTALDGHEAAAFLASSKFQESEARAARVAKVHAARADLGRSWKQLCSWVEGKCSWVEGMHRLGKKEDPVDSNSLVVECERIQWSVSGSSGL